MKICYKDMCISLATISEQLLSFLGGQGTAGTFDQLCCISQGRLVVYTITMMLYTWGIGRCYLCQHPELLRLLNSEQTFKEEDDTMRNILGALQKLSLR